MVRRILAGDSVAAERYVTEYSPRIHRLLRYLTGSDDEAEDLTQQVFIKAWQGLETFRGEASIGSWLHGIAYREYVSWLRSRKEHAGVEAAEHLPDTAAARRME